MKAYPIRVIRGRDEFAPPELLQDLQINVDYNEGRFRPFEGGGHEGAVSIVGYGPSLRDSVEEIRKADRPVWTVSGAHDFLKEKGVKPDFHTDIDWRDYKMHMVTPVKGVRYIMGNTIHPRYADKLKVHDLVMFQPVGDKVAPMFRLGSYPRLRIYGEVSTAALAAAYAAGFREMHMYGFDGCVMGEELYAGEHAKGDVEDDVTYVTDDDYNLYATTTNLIVANINFCSQVDSMEDAYVIVHGPGLLAKWLQIHELRKING